MSVLDEIIAGVKEDLADRKIPRSEIEAAAYGAAPVIDCLPIMRVQEMAVIAEVKRSSPSKGALATIADPAALAEQYQEAGASAISVLTERRRFSGSLADLDAVRKRVSLPILRKDFIVDGFQIVEAKAIGADVILLIAACLTKEELKNYGKLAEDLGMEVLYEVHTQEDLDKIDLHNKIIGINNRNLNTFKVDLENSVNLANQIPDDCIKIAESGLSDPRILMWKC